MKNDRWQQINVLFQLATERTVQERAKFLDEACRDDDSLRRELESLLISYERAGNFIESPAFEVAPELLTNDDRPGAFVGESIGHYRIESLIGLGGMGEVYLARDELLGRRVALKFLPESLTAGEAQLNRLEHEARTASALNHPNILTVHEIGVDGSRHFIATEFIEGETLRAVLARRKLDLREALEIAIQVGSALAAAHQSGVLHRDIKPENIMLRPDGFAKLLDFGIAKLTEQPSRGSDSGQVERATASHMQPDLVAGTARYMSPEQTRGEQLDARSDIWSLGVVLYEMLAGTPPFPGATRSGCVASILETEPAPLSGVLADVPAKLESIVQKALRKNRDERYQAIRELLDDLRNFQREIEVEGAVSKIKWYRRAASLTLGAGVLAATAFAYLFYFGAPAPRPSEKSIAILPFADLSPGRDQEYFCDGIQEEVLNRLSRIADLKVISRTSVQRFKRGGTKLPQIARQLGVAHILEGTVQKVDDRVRVTVQLIKAQNDSHLWSQKYDRKLTDIFAVESEIATHIAAVLRAKLTGAEEQALASRPTQNPEAHQLYLKASSLLNKRTAPNLRSAIQHFQGAIDKDPNYALAYAGLADAYALLTLWGGEGPRATVPKAKAAARKALDLDETLAEAHHSLGVILALYDSDFVRSRKEFERAIELNPNFAAAHHQLANLNLVKTGEFDRAIAEGSLAVELDPLSPIINADHGRNLLWARRYDEAIEQFQRTLSLDPDFYYLHYALGEALQLKGQIREAISEYEKAAQATDDPTATALLAQAYACNGERDKAEELLLSLENSATKRNIGPCTLALIHVALGEGEKAIDELELAWRERMDPDINEIKVEPLLDPLRGDPRFERLLAKVMASATTATAQFAENSSIAVLPFTDLSQARDQQYFCEGIQQEILRRLSHIHDLKVISRTSTQQFRGARQDLPQIASKLGVANVLEGSIQKTEDAVRVNVQLIHAISDTQLWAEKYDRKLTDVFAVESEIAKAIADTLRARLSGAEKQAIAARPTLNSAAHQSYLKGTYFFNKRTSPDLRTAIEYFEDAIGKDQNYALAYAGLADAYTILSVLAGENPTETVSKAKAAARKALQLDDTLPEAHNSLGLVLAYYEFDFAESRKEFERAIELNPNYADAHHQFGNVNLIKVGEFDRAIAEGLRAVELDPLSIIINADLGQNYFMARRYDEAIEQNRKTLALDPRFYIAHWNLAEALQMKGQLREAIAEYEKTVELTDDPRALAMLAQAHAKIGDTDRARGLLSQLEQLSAKGYVGAFRLALVHLGLGEEDKALAEIERACREPVDPDVINLKIEPLLDPLRGQPRFERLVAKIAGAAENKLAREE
jgi:serine/threonine-protein kinase